jgi:tetratricopeptide (TPR) repeat protein
MTDFIKNKPLRAAMFSVAALSLLAMPVLASAQAQPSQSVLEVPEDAELLGDYLAGTYANFLDDAKARSEYFTKAFEASPDNVNLGRRAVTSALTAGDFELAKEHAKDVYKVDNSEAMAQTILAVDAFSRGRHSSVKKYLNSNSSDITMGLVMSFVEGWNEVALGKEDRARDHFEKMLSRPFFGELAKLQIAKIDAMEGNTDLANAAFENLESPGQSTVETALATARHYANSGQVDKAKARLQKYLDESGLESGPLRAYLDRLEDGKSIDKPLNAKQQLSRSLTDPSYEFFLRNRAPDAAEVWLRLAVHIDPKNEKAKLWLASLLENTERSDEAMEIYKSFPDRSTYIVSAKLSEANIYFDREEDDKALVVLEEINAKQQSFTTREALGRARLIRENYEEALPIYTAIVGSMSEEEIRNNTQPLYFRGIAYERTKRWPEAEADFLRVLEIEPDNADALNYLGYTWVDRVENLERAFEMIRRAVEMEPDSGAIVDSLGWAHYKLGQYEEAKVQLEKAVTLSPSSATIIDHLGDVYWKLGRYREAGYQWERALLYDPTDEERETIKQKLQSGLSAATPAP